MSALGLTADKNGKEVVRFNNKDQHVGDPSVQVASVLGVLVKRNIPLKHKDWRLVPREAKDNIWAIIMQRFIVDDFYKDYYLEKMGSYLKEARSRKAGKILALDELEEEEREMKLVALKPENDIVNEWEEFVAHVRSEEFRAKRLQMQQVRQKHTTSHTLSREGYARLKAKMQKKRNTKEDIDRVELWITGHKQKEGKEPNPGIVEALEKIERAAEEHGAYVGSSVTDDFISKSLGDDKPGRLRGIGYGVTKTKMVFKSHYKKIIKECKDSMTEMNARLALLEEKTSRCVCCHDGSHLNKSGKASNTHGIASTSRIIPQLLSWYNENEVVADAIIAETDPKMEFHVMPIDFGAYKVTVTTSRVDDAHLYKPSGDLKRVLDVVGTYVRWAKDLIMPAI
ncbi:uncharacterized protein LOC113311536 [Papaver somniferum]|uniref:uncharacterized protein LOC113311536 n=1 Tax=Papaver somniferum TaxID=3469 RepID=UPI000E6F6813|nr:uncharacterized protein LOC113311536 [Papaver somniferum]